MRQITNPLMARAGISLYTTEEEVDYVIDLTVKAGEFLQVLDVDGRQCSDLQCFSVRKLEKGIVHPIDPTTTLPPLCAAVATLFETSYSYSSRDEAKCVQYVRTRT